MNKILLVEHNSQALQALEYALKQVSPRYLGNGSFDVARCFYDAQRKINEHCYGLVILSDRIPKNDSGDLADTHFRDYPVELETIGYSLIPQIRSRKTNAIIIGTTLLPDPMGISMADYFIRNTRAEAECDLDSILSRLPIRFMD